MWCRGVSQQTKPEGFRMEARKRFLLGPRISWGIHGLPKYRQGPPCPTTLCPGRWPLLEWPYSRFKGGCQQGGRTAVVLLPLCTPHAIRAGLVVKFLSHRISSSVWRGLSPMDSPQGLQPKAPFLFFLLF
jgi:hypothetical protein